MKWLAESFFGAVAFMTRLPVPINMQGSAESLASSAAFFPVVGLLISGGTIAIHHALARFVSLNIVVFVILVFLVAITGGLHEDALADAADGFGGGWEKEQVLAIMRDSRIGSFGALAIVLALLGRFVCLRDISPQRLDSFLVAGEVTCRWTALPLAYLLRPAREQSGQAARVAGRITPCMPGRRNSSDSRNSGGGPRGACLPGCIDCHCHDGRDRCLLSQTHWGSNGRLPGRYDSAYRNGNLLHRRRSAMKEVHKSDAQPFLRIWAD